MKRKLICCLMGLCLMLSMAACGNSADSAASASDSASDAASSVEASAEESSAEESTAEAEDSAVEEPTADELFAALVADADSICMKLQCYDHRGTPIRNGSVTLTADGEEMTFDTDFSGIALIDGLTADSEYTVVVTDGEEEEPATYGTVTMKLVDDVEYAATADEDGVIEVSVPDGTASTIDMAITATENDEESSFDVSRVSCWEPEEE